MAVQTTGSGPAPGWRAGPQGSGDLPSPVPFPEHKNTSCKQDSPLSLCIRNLLAAPALLAALGWDVWEEMLSCKTEVLKLKFVKTKSLPTFCYCWAQSVSTRDDVRAVSPSCLCLSSVWECLCSHFCSGHYHQPPEQRSLGEVLVCVLGSSDRFKSPSSSSDSCAYH